MRKPTAHVYTGDAREILNRLPAALVHCCVTSPPFWGLRDYGTAHWEGGNPNCNHAPRAQIVGSKTDTNAGSLRDKPFHTCPRCGAHRVDNQIGLEKLHDCLSWATGVRCGSCYVCHVVGVFSAVKRVLRDDGCCFLNLGDSYVANGSGQVPQTKRHIGSGFAGPNREGLTGLAPKNLCGVPWRVALALQADGWYLRSDIIWHKPNAMPSSAKDRPTIAHEYIFLLTKSARYFWDGEAVKEPVKEPVKAESAARYAAGFRTSKRDVACANISIGANTRTRIGLRKVSHLFTTGRNLRSVWTITTKPCREAHFATFPIDLPERCIKAAASEKGVCPKCGKQWVRVVEKHLSGVDESRPENGMPGREGNGLTRMRAGDSSSHTTGWRHDCECGLEPVPATVLDPFCGAGTTGLAALKLGQSFVGTELNPNYAALSRRRLHKVLEEL